MSASTLSISNLAGEASHMFERRTRDDDTSFVTLADGAPKWIHDLVMEAHGDFLPEDWRYKAIRDALLHIEDCQVEREDELDDEAHEFADANVNVYTHDLLRWLASNLNRPAYVDEAVEELGHSDGGIIGDIALGQYTELSEVFGIVRQSLAERYDELSAEMGA